MSVEEIKALNVASLADENCELYLWTTQKYLPDAFEVLNNFIHFNINSYNLV